MKNWFRIFSAMILIALFIFIMWAFGDVSWINYTLTE